MSNAGSLRTMRLSATSGTRTLASMIASSSGGAGSPLRVFKFISKRNNISPSDYYFNYLGGSRSEQDYFKQLYHSKGRGYI